MDLVTTMRTRNSENEALPESKKQQKLEALLVVQLANLHFGGQSASPTIMHVANYY